MKFSRSIAVFVFLMVLAVVPAHGAESTAAVSGRIPAALPAYGLNNVEYKDPSQAMLHFEKMAENIQKQMKEKKIDEKTKAYLLDILEVELEKANFGAGEIQNIQTQIDAQISNCEKLGSRINSLLKKFASYIAHKAKIQKGASKFVPAKAPEFENETAEKFYLANITLDEIEHALSLSAIDKKSKAGIEKGLKTELAGTAVIIEAARAKKTEIALSQFALNKVRVKIAELMQMLTKYQPEKEKNEEYKPRTIKK